MSASLKYYSPTVTHDNFFVYNFKIVYRLMYEKRDKSKFKKISLKSPKKLLYSFICILTDYMGHEATKQF